MILFGYLLRAILARLAISVPILVLIYLAFDLGDRGRFLAATLGWGPVLRSSLLHVPLVVVQILPVALIVSAALAFSVLQERGELDAMASLGMSPGRGCRPVLFAGCLCCGLSAVLDEVAVPACEQAVDRVLGTSTASALTGLRAPTTWARHGRWYYHQRPGDNRDPRRRGVRRSDARELLALEVDDRFVVRRRVDGWISSARPGEVERAVVRELAGGRSAGLTRKQVRALRLPGLARLSRLWDRRAPRAESLDSLSLEKWLQEMSRAGQVRTAELLVLHTKIAYPLINLLVAILACPFVVGFRRRTPVRDVAVAVLISLGIWVLLAGGWVLGRSGWVDPWIAVWSPVAFGFVAGALLVTRMLFRR